MANSESNMSLYGKVEYNPYEKSAQWIEKIKREESIKKHHKVLNGDDEVIQTYFKGRKPIEGPDPSKDISYYNNYKQRPEESLYERTFQVKSDYCPKLHRDDRQHKVGLDLPSEVVNKAVPTTSSSMYGKRKPIEESSRQYARVNIIKKEFFRSSGGIMEG